MKRSNHLRCVIAMLAGLCSGTLLAQDSVDQGGNNNADTSNVNVVASTADDSSTAPRGGTSPEPQYTAALNGTGLISLNEVDKHLLFSSTVGGGWDSNP